LGGLRQQRGLSRVELAFPVSMRGFKGSDRAGLQASWRRCRAYVMRNGLVHRPKGQHCMVAAAIRPAES